MDKSSIPSFIRQLLNNEDNEIEIQPNEEPFEEYTRPEQVFSPEELKPHINFDCIGVSNEINSGKTPFDEMSSQFEDLHPNGWLKKKVVKQGEGEKVLNYAVVYFHYNSYIEMSEVPFDSSFLRNEKPMRIQLGVGAVYEGMEHSLLSMTKGEKAHFLVHPNLAFGKFGVPPRIPGNATILNTITIHDIIDCASAIQAKYEKEPNNGFDNALSRAKGLANLAKDHFSNGFLPAAIKQYKESLSECERAIPESKDHRTQLNKMLLLLYINLMVCYNHKKCGKPKEVISTAREAMSLIPSLCSSSSKLFFNLGKAHLELNDYDKATLNFKKSLSLEPLNSATLAILKELEGKASINKAKETEMWSKGLGIKQQPKEEDSSCIEPSPTKKSALCPLYTENEMHNMEEEIHHCLSSFKLNSRQSTYSLPGSFMSHELEIYKRISHRLGLVYEEVKSGMKMSFRITRPSNTSE